jgi:hypothetical protein
MAFIIANIYIPKLKSTNLGKMIYHLMGMFIAALSEVKQENKSTDK